MGNMTSGVTASPYSKKMRSLPLQGRAPQSIQPTQDLSKSVQLQSGKIETLQAYNMNPQGTSQLLQSKCGECKPAEAMDVELLQPGSGKPECVQPMDLNLLQSGSGNIECVQPEDVHISQSESGNAEFGQSKEGNLLQHKSENIEFGKVEEANLLQTESGNAECVQLEGVVLLQPTSENTECVQPDGAMVLQHESENAECVQPDDAMVLQPESENAECVREDVMVLQPASENAECVREDVMVLQPESENAECESVQSQTGKSKQVQSQQSKINPVQWKKLKQRKGITKHLQQKRKRNRSTQRLPKKPKQPLAKPPVSLRMQTKIAIQNSQKDVIQVLTFAEERKRMRMDTTGWTALHDACFQGQQKVVKDLLKGGALVNDKGPNGDTPLFDAVSADNIKLVKLLITHGADPHIKNFQGVEASFYANDKIKKFLQTIKEKTQVTNDNESTSGPKRNYTDGQLSTETTDDDITKKKKKKEAEDKEPMAKPVATARSGPGRAPSGTKPPGPASKTGAAPLGKSGGKGSSKTQSGKGAGGKKGGKSQSQSKQDRKSPVQSQKSSQSKDAGDGDTEEVKSESGPKVPPLKIVIPGGAGGSGGRNEQEEGGTGQRGSGKGRGGGTLPYVIPCTTTDAGQTSDSSDGNSDDKRLSECGKTGQRVLRSHRTNDDKDKGRTSPHTGAETRGQALSLNKSPPQGSSKKHFQDHHDHHSSRDTSELHPRKRKIKTSKDSHRESRHESTQDTSLVHAVTHSNPYQMHLQIRKQVEERQKSLFPVKPKPPKDFHKYLMNRCTYTLQGNVNPPAIEIPPNLAPLMVEEFKRQEQARTHLRMQHLVEKEKLVLSVEQEILRVHGRAERAVANQALPYSVCTVLRDKEVCNLLAPEQEEKRNAQRSRCNGRQINSWLQEVDDKWEKIKEVMLRRQNMEAETLHASQIMEWEWKLKDFGLCEFNSNPKIDPVHVPQIHVSNFDLRA
ncbi:PREDICTED: ankyrin repeat domain-containing protein 12 isoform X2 [Papilio xuthus]|uniref:Ankyrin repeat domain-containing protein 12 isoform X2 n=1 Tax=Papilio xuthus TaxID=66420 RepID=A0AAJ6YZL0_PAPXU|nr:PREDICTED: ankyrin repeat domain-containing protein 12 isoform X2 [Papilio xuthus]